MGDIGAGRGGGGHYQIIIRVRYRWKHIKKNWAERAKWGKGRVKVETRLVGDKWGHKGCQCMNALRKVLTGSFSGEVKMEPDEDGGFGG